MHHNPVTSTWATLNGITPWWPVIAVLIVILFLGWRAGK